MPKLRKIILGSYSFTEVRTACIQGRLMFLFAKSSVDLPSLETLEIGHVCFQGDKNWNKNIVELKNLPELTTLVMRDHVGKKAQFLSISSMLSMFYNYSVDVFSKTKQVNLQLGHIFNKEIRMAVENCDEDTINQVVQAIL